MIINIKFIILLHIHFIFRNSTIVLLISLLKMPLRKLVPPSPCASAQILFSSSFKNLVTNTHVHFMIYSEIYKYYHLNQHYYSHKNNN